MISKTLFASAIVALPLTLSNPQRVAATAPNALASTTLASTTLATLAPALQPSAQDRAVKRQEPDPGAFAVEFFRPDTASAFEIQAAAKGLFQNVAATASWLGSEDYNQIAMISVQALGDRSLMIAAPTSWLPKIIDYLQRAEAELTMDPTAAQGGGAVETFQYQIRHVAQSAIERALDPFRATSNGGLVASSRNGIFDPHSITIVRETSSVIVRKTKAEIEEIKRVLERVDRPEQQIRLTYYLVRGYTDERAAADEGLELTDLDTTFESDFLRDLRELIPLVGVRTMSFGVLQGNALATKQFSDSFVGGNFNLLMRPTAFDEQTGALAVDSIEFEFQMPVQGKVASQGFTTAAKLEPGRYTILGGVGAQPIFLVLHMSRM